MRTGRPRLREGDRVGEGLRYVGCERDPRRAGRVAGERDAAAGNAGPRTSKTAWTDAAAVAIFMMRLSKRAPGADIADREAR
ncbi:hypothetical protein JM78_31415 [Burkholderia pyrrocinia]|nr:hypothetical protein JM78_31415 [Burkholderia pyrrocinia]